MYDKEELRKYPFAIVNVVAASTGQPTMLPGAIVVVVVVIDPPLLSTQLGKVVHDPLARHVTFKLPPLLMYPALHISTMNEFANTVVASAEAASRFL